MAHHLSAKKRIRQAEIRRLNNRYYSKTTNAIKKLRSTKNKEEAAAQLPVVSSLLDKLAKKNIIHKNKAANLKSGLTNHVTNL